MKSCQPRGSCVQRDLASLRDIVDAADLAVGYLAAMDKHPVRPPRPDAPKPKPPNPVTQSPSHSRPKAPSPKPPAPPTPGSAAPAPRPPRAGGNAPAPRKSSGLARAGRGLAREGHGIAIGCGQVGCILHRWSAQLATLEPQLGWGPLRSLCGTVAAGADSRGADGSSKILRSGHTPHSLLPLR